ncbi:MAG: methyl-accepting chemotaxis protein [Planctomycetota bacterium]
MPRLTIRRKITSAFAVCVSLIVVLAVVVFFSTQRLNAKQDALVQHDMPTRSLALGLQGHVHAVLSAHRGYIILGLDELKQECVEIWKLIDHETTELVELVHEEANPQLDATMAELTDTLHAFRDSQARIVAIAHTPENLPANAHFDRVVAPLGKTMVENLEQILDEEDNLAATPDRKHLIHLVASAEAYLLKVNASILAYLNTGDPAVYETFQHRLAACSASVEKLKKETHLFTNTQQKAFDRYITARTEFIQQAGVALEQRGAPDWNQAQFICANTVTPLAHKADELLALVIASAEQRVNDHSTELQDAASAMSTITLGVAGAVVLIACIVAYLLSRMICPPLLRAAEAARRIGQGDLTARLAVTSNDELGDLAQGINAMAEQTGQVITTVLEATRDVASAATEIAASSEEMASGMSEQSGQLSQVSAAVEEMSASVIEVARKSADASNSAQQSGETAEHGGDVVQETIIGMSSISQAVVASAASVQELGKRGDEIGQVINVINDIADQTNLLALNAAIEAARAGEHGRGFAVVADEVRKLADRTTQATEEIADSITAIQSETTGAVNKMNAGTEQVEVGVTKAKQAGDSLAQIVSSANEVAEMIQSIAAAAEEQSAAAEQVSSSVDAIAQVTRQATQGTSQAAQAASQLSTKSEELLRLVSSFTIDAGPNTSPLTDQTDTADEPATGDKLKTAAAEFRRQHA